MRSRKKGIRGIRGIKGMDEKKEGRRRED